VEITSTRLYAMPVLQPQVISGTMHYGMYKYMLHVFCDYVRLDVNKWYNVCCGKGVRQCTSFLSNNTHVNIPWIFHTHSNLVLDSKDTLVDWQEWSEMLVKNFRTRIIYLIIIHLWKFPAASSACQHIWTVLVKNSQLTAAVVL